VFYSSLAGFVCAPHSFERSETALLLLHRLWVSGEVYEPLRNSQKAISAAA